MALTPLAAADIYARHVAEARAHFLAQSDAIYARWLCSDMEITTRDQLMAAADRGFQSALNAERQLFRLNLANPHAWGSAVNSKEF